MSCDSDGYEKMGYMGEENIERDTWTGGRARLCRVRTDEELREVYKDVGI